MLDENDQESYYGSIIPNDMLIGEDTSPEVSFTMSMPDLRNKNNRGERTYGPSEKNGSHREKDTK
jgi:hypothetical protein